MNFYPIIVLFNSYPMISKYRMICNIKTLPEPSGLACRDAGVHVQVVGELEGPQLLPPQYGQCPA